MGANRAPGCVSVVLVSHNTIKPLRDALRALRQLDEGLISEILVVDNASSDGSVQMLRSEFPDVRVMHNVTNVGFGIACNQGVEQALGDYVMLLNSDTRVQPGAVPRLLEALVEQPGVALVGPRLINEDGSLQRSAYRFPTPLILLLEQTNLAQYIPAVAYTAVHHGTRPASVEWLKGACLLARRSVLRQMGPFDPRFFMYAEDIDLCLRLRKQGWDIRYVPDAVVVHLGGRSAAPYGDRMVAQFVASMYLFYVKHYGPRMLRLAHLVFGVTAAAKRLRDAMRIAQVNSPWRA